MSIPVGRSEDSASQKWRYDVFLSFRSEDTRRSFTSHLYLTLRDKGVNVFIDDNRLCRSGDISSETVQAIQSSRFSIIVFSRNYADSILCLQELSEIINCRRTLGHTVLPVFYNVDPSHVRNQRGSFGEAFARHEERMVSDKGRATIARWKEALTTTGNLSGWDLTNLAKGSEATIIREIARQIWVDLKHTYLDVPKFLVGLNSRLNDMNLLLNDGSDAVCFVGICGMGGIGKTTLAKQLYNQFFHRFEAKSFLGNVRENSARPDDLVRLQEQLLRDVLKVEKVNLMNVNKGVTMIKQRIHSSRVLIVLDDVDHADQLKSLARDRSWFGPGSRIVITTRNVDLLKDIGVDHVYMLAKLNGSESLQLFNWHAFQNHPHSEEFAALSHQITSYCMGLPLALQVLGCFLHDRTVVEWRSALEKLKKSPNGDIQKQLKISFDGLEDDNEKEIFLHIACFFVGWGKEHTVKILHGCGLSAAIGVNILCERFLVEFQVQNSTLMMHDLVRDMGREIVRKESPMNPGKRSRLWLHTDILSTLRNKQGTNTVEGLMLNPPEKQEVSTESFTGMSQLKLLQLNNVHVSIGKHGLLSQELRWVSWHHFPLKVIPKEFYMGNMVSVDMQYSKLEVAWQSTEILKNLKVLNLSHSHSLTKTPNFLQVPDLEELILEDCVELKEVDESIGHLRGLVLLNLQNCKKLKNLPDRICSIKSLQVLDINGCFNIKKLPHNFGEMESLVKFIAHGTSIEHIPPSISRLKSLTELSLYNHRTSSTSVASLWSRIFARETPKGNSQLITSLEGLTLLKSLSLMGCNLVDGSIPATFKNLQFLEDLYLAENDFRYLPDSMSQLSNLSYVRMDDCPNLVSLPAMPPSLCYLNTSNCTSLESISLQEVECAVLCSPNCPKLYDVSGLGNWTMDGSVQFVGCKNLSTQFQDFLLKDWHCGKYSEFVLPRSEIPCWFDYHSQSPSFSFQLPSCQSCKVKVVTVCVVGAYYKKSRFFAGRNSEVLFCPGITVRTKTRTFRFSIIAHQEYDRAALREDHMVGFHLSHREIVQEKDCEVEVTVNPAKEWLVKRVGVYFRRDVCDYCRIREEMISDSTGIGIQAESKRIVISDDEDDRQPKRRRRE